MQSRKIWKINYYLFIIIAVFIISFIMIVHLSVNLSTLELNDVTLYRNNYIHKVDTITYIDWHNYTQIKVEKQQKGLGEQGRPVYLNKSEAIIAAHLYKLNGFNAMVSDKISLHRSLEDIRHDDCRRSRYQSELPSVSIIIPFHQEHWSTLLRTFISAINRAPRRLIKEVILVDDFSTHKILKRPLQHYVDIYYKDIVRIIRAPKRLGLIRTRLLGAKHAVGDVLIFLDSHCECNINWLPPLLEPIAQNYRTVACPFIDVIDMENFEYRSQDPGRRGAFDWNFDYKRIPRLRRDDSFPAQPFDSPIMAGGLFAISRKWFWELGGYDPGLEIWGGEQYELSFKIWQCGGRMVDTPCSRIGHVYRKFIPFDNGDAKPNFVNRNFMRVAEVWMDEYKEYIYKTRGGQNFNILEIGNISAQLEVRKRLKCKPFKWFLTEVAFDLTKYYPLVEPALLANGLIRNLESNMCLEYKQLSIIVKKCSSEMTSQKFHLTWHMDIRPEGRRDCLDFFGDTRSVVTLFPCHNSQGNQFWMYNLQMQQLTHPSSNKCLEYTSSEDEGIIMNPCSDNTFQKWILQNVNADLMEKIYKKK